MNIVDIIVILILCYGAFMGFKRGFTYAFLSCVGLISIIMLSYVLKNPISVLLYTYLPFFKFGGFFKGLTVLNILLYEVIAFFIVLSILMIVWKVVLFASKVFEKILKMTIILGIPSKILGLVFGLLESVCIAFLFLYIVSLPLFQFETELKKSKLREPILTKVPLIHVVADKTALVADEFNTLKEKYKKEESAEKFNLETLDLFLKYKVVKKSSVEALVKKGKLRFDASELEKVLSKYKEDTK